MIKNMKIPIFFASLFYRLDDQDYENQEVADNVR